MNLKQFIIPTLLLGALCSCSNDPKDDKENSWIVYFQDVNAFDESGVWKFCYNPEFDSSLTFTNFNESINFSHKTIITEWDGMNYYSWSGFCPSKSSDTKDYTSEGSWTDHQWTAMPGKGMQGQSNYMVACCDAKETAEDAITSTTVVIKPTTDDDFCPKYIYLTNTTYGLYSMKNGSAFNRPFTNSDWCKVTISGIDDGAVTGTVDFYLAKDGEFVEKWTKVDLSPIHECERLVFTMESSDSGQWGMNNAAYFAVGAFIWGY